jgi:coproporphyrinogen III oxidase
MAAKFVEAAWERDGGGGGQARLLGGGGVFEKAGVNRALVEGILAAGGRRDSVATSRPERRRTSLPRA